MEITLIICGTILLLSLLGAGKAWVTTWITTKIVTKAILDETSKVRQNSLDADLTNKLRDEIDRINGGKRVQ